MWLVTSGGVARRPVLSSTWPEGCDREDASKRETPFRSIPQSEMLTLIFVFPIHQAIGKDPGYALAYSGLGDTYSLIPSYEGGNAKENFLKSNAAARKAMELDPTLARPHAVLGSNEMEFDWNFAGGEAEFKKAFELDPNDATAHQWYADSIGVLGGREQEAIEEMNRAHQLDPLSLEISVEAGGIHYFARQYDEMIAACKKVAAENPAFAGAHGCLCNGYWAKRIYQQAVEECKLEGQLSGNRRASEEALVFEQGFRSAGVKGALTKVVEWLQAQRKENINGAATPFRIAVVYARLGDKERALQWLNTAYQEHDMLLVGLKTDEGLDSIRSDPRFAELVRKVGLPQ